MNIKPVLLNKRILEETTKELQNPSKKSLENIVNFASRIIDQLISAMTFYAMKKIKFTEPLALFETISSPKCGKKSKGIYMIHHKDLGIVYIGKGILKSRRSRHLSKFRNPELKDSISPAAMKMRKYDMKEDNWEYSYCVLPDVFKGVVGELILIRLEEKYCEIHNPPFNNTSMIGK